VSRFPIIDRLDAALEKMRARQMDVRAIYLTETDRAALDRAESARWKRKLHVFHYQGHDLRTGEESRIYSTHGVPVRIPPRLSARVAA
jgi:hypothetical protein